MRELICTGGSRGARRPWVSLSPGSARCCAGCRPSGRPQGAGDAEGGHKGAGHDQAEQLLGPGRSGRAAGSLAGRCREIECVTAASWSLSTSACRAASGSASARPLPGAVARKPGALAGSVALSQERERGAWPSFFDELWGKITERYGPSEAARQMVDVLMLAREHGASEVELAVRGALTAGAHDGARSRCWPAVAIGQAAGARRSPPRAFKGSGRHQPTLDHYDQLLAAERAR